MNGDASWPWLKHGEMMEALGAFAVQDGAGPLIWRRILDDALTSHVEARDSFIAKRATQATFGRFYGTAYIVGLGADQIETLANRIVKLTGDAALAKARRSYIETVGSAKNIRDLLAHYDEYAVGAGRRQIGKGALPAVPRRVQVSVIWTDLGESYFSIGQDQIAVDRVAKAAIALAETTEQTRFDYQAKAVSAYATVLEA